MVTREMFLTLPARIEFVSNSSQTSITIIMIDYVDLITFCFVIRNNSFLIFREIDLIIEVAHPCVTENFGVQLVTHANYVVSTFESERKYA